MEELIKVATNAQGSQVVSAKELHDFLGFDKSQWSRWAKKNIVDNLFAIENEDWVGFDIVSKGNKTKDYAISLDFSKRLSMMARTEKGEQARRYFIECEKKLNGNALSRQLSPEEMFLQSAQIMVEQKRQIAEVKQEVKQLAEAVANIQVVNASIEYFSIMGYCRNIHKQISLEQAKVYGIKCRAMCNQLGFSIGKVPDPRFGTVNTYPLDVLKEIIK